MGFAARAGSNPVSDTNYQRKRESSGEHGRLRARSSLQSSGVPHLASSREEVEAVALIAPQDDDVSSSTAEEASSPRPPRSRSRPGPPRSSSSPARPRRTSSPASAMMTSSPCVAVDPVVLDRPDQGGSGWRGARDAHGDHGTERNCDDSIADQVGLLCSRHSQLRALRRTSAPLPITDRSNGPRA